MMVFQEVFKIMTNFPEMKENEFATFKYTIRDHSWLFLAYHSGISPGQNSASQYTFIEMSVTIESKALII